VPLLATGAPIGAISLAWAETDRRYSRDDLAFAMELAHRAALAVENARLYRDLQVAIRVRDDFLAAAGHELKTPLTALLMQLQSLQRLAAREATSETLKERLGRAVRAGVRLERLIHHLLDVALLTRGRLVLEPERLDLVQLAREVVDRFADTDAGSDPIVLRAPPALEGLWDRFRIDQVLTNLMANALKYGGDEPVVVELSQEGDQAILRVTDQGIGIAPEDHERIFEQFERGAHARGLGGGGFGLGLWITREIVRAAGGYVAVTSALGKGSTFVVGLPLAPPSAPGDSTR
jgi:signal transduction histidine kinase